MASPFDYSSSQSAGSACQVEESHQEKPKPRPAAKKRQGGFDCEFIEYPPKPFQADCPICLLVLCQPHQVTCCGYGFCRVCIERIQTDKKSCPTCNRKDFSVFPDLRLQRSLYEFRVWCSHKTEGCEWSGELSQLEKHLNESPKLDGQLVGCQFTEVECHHCCDLFQRRYVTTHQIGQCIRRPFSCDYCGNYEADFEDVTTKHWPVCGFRPVPCPNECGVYPERLNLEHHVSKDCLLTVVNCDFHYAGCEVQLVRQDLPAHLAENLVPHMSQLATYSHMKIKALTNALEEKESKISQLRSSLHALQSHGSFPVELTMTEFEQHKQDDDIWYSEPFYTHPHGYKLCLKVFANGALTGKGTHVAVGVCLMQGLFDASLKWPCCGEVTIQVINQLQDKEHYVCVTRLSDAPDDITSKVTKGEIAHLGWFPNGGQELSHSDLGYDPAKNRQLLKDDCLHLRVTRVTNTDWTSLEMRYLAIESRVCVPPIEFAMSNFEQQKASNDTWYSPPFYTHPQGYRMFLCVYAGDGTHVSVYVHLMRGEHDNFLKWPFRGDIIIQLLNVLENKGHYKKTIDFTDKTPDDFCSRMTTQEKSKGWGFYKFISHRELNYNPANNCCYLKYDSLQFKISQVELK